MAGKTNEMKTEMTAAQIAAKMNDGQWYVHYDIPEERFYVAERQKGWSFGTIEIAEMKQEEASDEADAHAIVNAVSATYKAGYAPEGIAPVVEALKEALEEIKTREINEWLDLGYRLQEATKMVAELDLVKRIQSALDAITIKPKNEE